MDRPSDVEVRTILRRTASITVIGAVASIAFSVSPAKAGTRGTIPPSWTDFLALAMPQPELSFAVHGQLHWYSHELCGFGDRVPVPAIVFSNQRGKVVGSPLGRRMPLGDLEYISFQTLGRSISVMLVE